MSDENVTPPATRDYRLNPQLSHYGTKTRVEFDGSCLKQEKVTFNHGKVVNIYIVYEITKIAIVGNYDNHPTLQDELFGAVKLKKYADIDKYGYSGYGLNLIEDQDFHIEAVKIVKF